VTTVIENLADDGDSKYIVALGHVPVQHAERWASDEAKIVQTSAFLRGSVLPAN
jgi:hypothetical protein